MNQGLPPNPNQDLLRQVKPKREPLPKGFWTLLGIEIISVLLAALTGWIGKEYLSGALNIWTAASLASVFFAVSAFGTFFDPAPWRRFLCMFLEAAAFVLVMGGENWRYVLTAGAMALLFSILGDSAAREELQNRVRIKLFPVARFKIGRAFTGFLLAGIILSVPAWRDSALPIPERQFSSIYGSSVKIVEAMYPDLKLNSTVTDLARSFAERQLVINSEFRSLPKDVQEKELSQAADNLLQNTEKNLGFNFSGETRVSEAFYQYVKVTVGNWKEAFGSSFLLVWGIGLFIFLRGLGALLVWFSILVCILGYEMLSAMGIFGTVGEASMRERLVINKG